MGLAAESTSRHPESLAIRWATAFVRALAAGGLTDVCISPGSRSTPLAFAFQAEPSIHTYLHLDERSAGFFALGLALGKGETVALLCTSGTAAANYFPAVIEANMSEVPLLVLTADRPHELRHSGANQTIDQVKLFGDQVLWAVDMALPDEDAPAAAWRNLERTAVRALARANGLRKGPVHLNFPFRKPLQPADPGQWPAAGAAAPSLSVQHGRLLPTTEQTAWLAELVASHPRGLIIAGPMTEGRQLAGNLDRLAAATGYPILVDPLSGLRYRATAADALLVSSYENYLGQTVPGLEPDLVLRLGAMPTSGRLAAFLARQETAVQILVRESGTWSDEAHVSAHLLQVDPQALLAELAGAITMTPDRSWREQWSAAEERSRAAAASVLTGGAFDGAYVAAMLELLPPDTVLLAGNSLPVRHVDQFGPAAGKPLSVFGNRGASGIDGNISTGLGLAKGTGRPAVLLVGDITFYHDSNGLLAVRNLGIENATIVLLNNNGGGIFQRLPVARYEPPFREFFQTPHNLDFSTFAAAYGLRYQLAGSVSTFREQLSAALADPRPGIIEVQTDPVEDLRRRAMLEEEVRRALASF